MKQNDDLRERITMVLKGIDHSYPRGPIQWLAGHPTNWRRVVNLEGEINCSTLAWDEEGLTKALSKYLGSCSRWARHTGGGEPLFLSSKRLNVLDRNGRMEEG